MNGKTKKKLGIGAAVLSIGAIAFYVVKRVLGDDECDEVESEIKENLESAGVDFEKFKEEMEDEEDNFVKALFVSVMFNNKCTWDSDVLDTGEAIQSENVIHIRESEFKGRKFLDFLVQIPDYTKKSYAFPKTQDYLNNLENFEPKIVDYIKTLNKSTEEIWKNVVRFSEKPRKSLQGFVSYSYHDLESDEVVTKIQEIDNSVYSKYADEVHDGLTRFYEHYKKTEDNPKSEDKQDLLESIKNNINADAVCIEEVFLVWKMSFPIQTQGSDGSFGINLETAIQTLTYLLTKLEISRNDGRDHKQVVTYDHILFHAPNEDGVWDDMSLYYDKRGGKVIVDNFIYE